MRPKFIILFVLAFIPAITLTAAKKSKVKGTVPAVSIWNYNRMLKVREAIQKGKNDADYREAYENLIANADKILPKRPTTVMDKADECIAKSGNKHDYITVGKYSWPNPDTPDGLPWIQKDGVRNPNYKRYDAPKQVTMVKRVQTLCLAYFFSGEEKYANKAVELAEAWFLDPETYMTPHLRFAQVIPGRDNDMGHSPGTIEGYVFVPCVASLSLIRDSKAYTPEFDRGMKKWFGDFAHWLKTDSVAIRLTDGNNNIAVAYDQQLLAYNMFSGNMDEAKRIIAAFPETRLYKQIRPDGKMPMELKRTLAYSYSGYNLIHMLEICEMARGINPDLFGMKNETSGTIADAVAFLASYLGKPEESFRPYRQISGWESAQGAVIWLCKRIQAFDSSHKWVELFDKYAPTNKKTQKNNINYLIY